MAFSSWSGLILGEYQGWVLARKHLLEEFQWFWTFEKTRAGGKNHEYVLNTLIASGRVVPGDWL